MQLLRTRTFNLWLPLPFSGRQCFPFLTVHIKYLTVFLLPINLVCGPSSLSLLMLWSSFISAQCSCIFIVSLLLTTKLYKWGHGHRAILKLLLANLLHIVKTASYVCVVKFDVIACRGQWSIFKMLSFEEILQEGQYSQ